MGIREWRYFKFAFVPLCWALSCKANVLADVSIKRKLGGFWLACRGIISFFSY